MKVRVKPIKMIARFKDDGSPIPVKFQFNNTVLLVDEVVEKIEEKLAGNRMIIFKCRSWNDGRLIPFELKYELRTCKWFLYKI